MFTAGKKPRRRRRTSFFPVFPSFSAAAEKLGKTGKNWSAAAVFSCCERNRVFGVAMKRIRRQRPFHRGRCRHVRHQKGVGQVSVQYDIKKALDKSACNARHRHSLANRHAETSSTHQRDRSTDEGSHLPPTLDDLHAGGTKKRRWTSPKYTNAQRSVTVIHSPTDLPRRAALTTVAAATPATESLPD